jgi:hypothetical protein
MYCFTAPTGLKGQRESGYGFKVVLGRFVKNLAHISKQIKIVGIVAFRAVDTWNVRYTKYHFYIFLNRCSTVHFGKYEIFLVQQMHYLLKHKVLQFVFQCLNVHFSAPTCFDPLGPSSGGIHQNLAKVTKIIVF